MTGIDGRAARRTLLCVLVAAVVLAAACGGGMFGQGLRVRRRHLPVARRIGRHHGQCVGAGAGGVARHRPQHGSGGAHRSRRRPRRLSVAGDRGHARQPAMAPERAALRAGAPARARHPQAVAGAAVCVVDATSSARRRAWSSTPRRSGASALRPGTLQKAVWAGGELVAFRLHLPSKIVWHNARELETNEPSSIARGNILAWEQALTDRLDGRPVAHRGAAGPPVDSAPARCGCSPVRSRPPCSS